MKLHVKSDAQKVNYKIALTHSKLSYSYDVRSFLCPKSFRAEHDKQIPVEAEYDNNKYNNNNLL